MTELEEKLVELLIEYGPLSIMQIEDHIDERTNDIIVALNSSKKFVYDDTNRWHLTAKARE